MAPLRMTPAPEDLAILKTAYDGLRAANEQLRTANLNIYHSMGMKLLYVPGSDENQSHHKLMEQHKRRAALSDQDVKRDWRQWLDRNRDVLDSAEVIDQELDRVNASKAELESVQTALRACINRLSRPYLRNLTILDLPDEILLEIFEHVEGQHYPFTQYQFDPIWYPRRDIQTLRLVCRRFCSISSQLLVRVVYVDLNQESLTRLEEISRHPTISKGVHAVKIVPHMYNSSFTEIEHFISYYAEEFENQIDLNERAKIWELSKISEDVASDMIARGKELVATLHRLLSREPCENEDHYRALLFEIHERYLVLLERQDSLIQSDDFYRLVGSAIARMPCAKSLMFDDSVHSWHAPSSRALMVPGADLWERLSICMLQPLTGYEVTRAHLEAPNYGCIIPLIDSVRRAGGFLRRLIIKIHSLGRPMDLVPAPDLRLDFSSGMQQLRRFSFEHEFPCGDEDSDDDEGQVTDLHEFLSACLDTSSLQSLGLDLRGGEHERHFPLCLRQIISRKQSLYKLDDIFLGQCALDYADLIAFLRRLPKSMDYLSLSNVRLLNGSWRGTLDALREKRPRFASLKAPAGAECEDMSGEEYSRLFEEEQFGYRTNAEAYLLNRWISNPMLADPPELEE